MIQKMIRSISAPVVRTWKQYKGRFNLHLSDLLLSGASLKRKAGGSCEPPNKTIMKFFLFKYCFIANKLQLE